MHRKCIPLYIQEDATSHSLFISGNCSTCFGCYFHPIIRSAYNCIYSIWYLSHRYCYLPLSWKSWNRFERAVGGVRRNGSNGPILNPLNPELNPICYLLALLGAHHFLHVSRIRVNVYDDNSVRTLFTQCLTEGSNYQMIGIRMHIHLQDSLGVRQHCQTVSACYVLVHLQETLSAWHGVVTVLRTVHTGTLTHKRLGAW